jgi:hypothetical protein
MSHPVPAPPAAGRTRYLQTFLISLVLVAGTLATLLFAVRMEAVVSATGIIRARDQQTVRAQVPGLIELGWLEAEIAQPVGRPLLARLDHEGTGLTDPTDGKSYAVRGGQVLDLGLKAGPQRFHKLEPGDVLWPGQVLGWVRGDGLRLELGRVQLRLQELQSLNQLDLGLQSQRDLLLEQLKQTVSKTPDASRHWMVLKVHPDQLAAVKAGDPLALLAPWDPVKAAPLELQAELDIDEAHSADLAPGHAVRLYTTTYNHRLYGYAEATLERVKPWGESGDGAGSRFHATAIVTAAPFPLKLGTTVKAEIVTGRKRVYRIILEH